MTGFTGFNNGTLMAANVDFRQVKPVAPQMVADGQLLIGSTVAPNIRAATLTAGTGVSITNGPGTITIGLTGGAVAVEHLTGNTGGLLNPDGSNNFNTLGTGSITVAGSGSTLTTQLTGLTNHAVLIGAGTATITKVGPTATTGQVLQSAGSSADPAFSTATYPLTTTINQILYSSAANTVVGLATANNGALITSAGGVPSIGTVPIAAGGTNATSMSTNTGIVKYDGTSLVTSTTAKIDSSNRYTNSSQPCVQAQVNAVTVGSITGDGTIYTIIFDAVIFDQGSNLNTSTGVFTAPVTGRYFFATCVSLYQPGAGHTLAQLNINCVGKTNQFFYMNPATTVASNTQVSISASTFLNMTAADTAIVTIKVSNSTKTVGIVGNASGANTWLSVFLVA